MADAPDAGPGREVACRAPARPPRASYRLQLHRDFPLDAAAGVCDYLAELGVSHVYTSPIFQAAPGSLHGYDGTDPTRIDDERGGEPGARRFWDAVAHHGLGHLLDIVPNHMATASQNAWWWDVLRHGADSRFARFFDIDWDDAPPVRLPILGGTLEEAVASGELRAESGPDGAVVRYYDHVLPLETGDADPDALSPDQLLALLKRQPYRIVGWREAQERINYRRFFDIATLVGLRVEDQEVFDATHARVLRLVQEGSVHGLRVDHPDGLRNPRAYLSRLAGNAPDAWLLVEKILEGEERLRPDWPVHGTTGYEFLNLAGALLVDPAGEMALSRCYRDFVGEHETWEELALRCKRLVLDQLFRPELLRLERMLRAALPGVREREGLREALVELLVCFPVYRSYVEPETGRVAPADAAAIERAVARARAQRPDLAQPVELVSELLLRGTGEARDAFVACMQQTTGPLMAKGVEDTAFYRYARLIALNEVGGDPSRFSAPVEAFHADAQRRQREEPFAMLATSTHDTNRSGDVRARIALLSEIPERWAEAVQRWRCRNEPHRRADAPTRALEYLLYQTLVGAHPLPLARALPYAEKAMREAKRRTAWIEVDGDYEKAVKDFVHAILGDPAFLRDLDAFVAPLVGPGRVNALAQTLWKLTAPGVPDLYQGTELWDLSLVDPDNRRPVDFALRRRLLAGLAPDTPPERVLADSDRGLPKLWLIQRALGLRRRYPEAFGSEGGYLPLQPGGPEATRIVAYARCAGGEPQVVAATPRFPLRPVGWDGTVLPLPPGRFTNVLTHESVTGEVPARALFGRFPVALLERA